MPLSESMIAAAAAMNRSEKGPEPRGLPCVIDTNVVLDLVFWHDPRSAWLDQALRSGGLHALRDGACLVELAEVLSRPHFLGSEEKALAAAADWCRRSVPADEEKVARAAASLPVRCRDPLDQKFLELAAGGSAVLLVSKDKLVLRAGRRMKRLGVAAADPVLAEALFRAGALGH
jgi:predicted nucleic acid-binding protein